MSSKENSHKTSNKPCSVAARVLMFERKNENKSQQNHVNNTCNGDSSEHSKASSISSHRNISFIGRFDV